MRHGVEVRCPNLALTVHAALTMLPLWAVVQAWLSQLMAPHKLWSGTDWVKTYS